MDDDDDVYDGDNDGMVCSAVVPLWEYCLSVSFPVSGWLFPFFGTFVSADW